MGKIINKLNLNRTPQVVENNSLIYAKNIRLTPDDTLCADTSLQKILSDYTYKGHIVGINNNIHLVLENNNSISKVKLYTYNELTGNINPIECGWIYNGGEICGNVVKNATNEEILTICEYSENKEIPIKHINLQKCKDTDDESIYTQNPIIPISNLHFIGKYNCTIPNGVYQFFIRYKIDKNFYTNWYSCSGDLHAGESNINNTIQGSLKYIDINTDCPRSFMFKIEHLIPDNLNIYKEFQLGFILTSGDTTVARSWKHFPIKDGNGDIINIDDILFDYDQDYIEEINIDDLLSAKFEIFNVKNITNYKNKQYIANYEENNINVDLPKPTIELIETEIGEINVNNIIKDYDLIQLNYKSESYKKDDKSKFPLITFYAKSFEEKSGQDDSNFANDKVLGNLYLIYNCTLENDELTADDAEKLNLFKPINQFKVRAENGGYDGYLLTYIENNTKHIIFDGELKGYYSYNWGAPNIIRYYKNQVERSNFEKHPLNQYKEFSDGAWFARMGFDENHEQIGFKGKDYVDVGTDSRHCEGEFVRWVNNAWKYKFEGLIKRTYPTILITKIHNINVTIPIYGNINENVIIKSIKNEINNNQIDISNLETLDIVYYKFNYTCDCTGYQIWETDAKSTFTINTTVTECNVDYNIIKNTTIIDNTTLGEHNRTLMPFCNYEFYIHGVKENGITTNGVFCNSNQYMNYNNLDNTIEIIKPKITITKDQLEKLSENYKAWFISAYKTKYKIAKGFNYFYDEETKYSYIQCLEADTLLFNLNKNITIYKQNLLQDGQSYSFAPITKEAEYISSGNNVDIRLFGNVGLIRWKNEKRLTRNYKPTTRKLIIPIVDGYVDFDLSLHINRKSKTIPCSYNIKKDKDGSIQDIIKNINDFAAATDNHIDKTDYTPYINVNVDCIGNFESDIIGVTERGTLVTNGNEIVITTIEGNNINDAIKYYKTRQNELRNQYISLTNTNIQNAQAVIDLTSNLEYTPIKRIRSTDPLISCIKDFSKANECSDSISNISKMELTTGDREDIANIIDTTQQELYDIAYNPIITEYNDIKDKLDILTNVKNGLTTINKDGVEKDVVILFSNPKDLEIGIYNGEKLYKTFNRLEITISSNVNELDNKNPIYILEITNKPIAKLRYIKCLESDYWVVLHKNTDDVKFKQLTRITPFLSTSTLQADTETNTYTFEDYTKMYLPAFICQIKKLDFNYCKQYYVNGTDIYEREYNDENTRLDLIRLKGYANNLITDNIVIPSEYNLNCVNLREDIVTAMRTWEETIEITDESSNIITETKTYNQLYKAVNSLLLSSIYELSTMYRDYIKQYYYVVDDNKDTEYKNENTKYNNTIRVSNADLDEQYRHIFKFSPEDYYIIPSNKGIITNLFTILDDMFIHTQHALYKFAGRNSLTTEGGEVALKETDIFDTGIQALLDSVNGFGGLNNKHHQTITYNNYIFYDAHNNVIYSFGGQQGIEDISRPIRYILDNYFPENVIFTPDELNSRVFINLKLKNGNICLTYSFLNKSFISIHDIDFSKGFNTRLNTYFIGFNDDYQTIHKVVNYIKEGDNKKYLIYGDCIRRSVLFTKEDYIKNKDDQPKSSIDILYNEGYETIKVLDYVNWINCRQLDEIDNSNMAEPSINEKYPGHTARIYSDRTNTGVLKLIDTENNNDISNDKNNLLYPDQQLARYNEGVWSLNSFRNIPTIEDKDQQSLIYGKYFVFRLIMNGYNFKLENIDFKIMDYGKV